MVHYIISGRSTEATCRITERLMKGLKSRVPHWIDFPDYSADELTDIFRLMIKERGFSATADAIEKAHDIFEKVRKKENFGNGRFVRNLIEHAIQNQSVRLLADGKDPKTIRKGELFKITKEDINVADEENEWSEHRRIGFAV